MLNLPKVFLPAEAREGDVLDVIIMLDDCETDMDVEIKKLVGDVWER